MTDKYEFIDAGYATVATDMAAAPTVMRMCEWLQISKSGFYEWRSRPESATAKRREMLKTKIRALFKANDSTYGYRRMHAALARGGEQAGLELVRALMRELGLVPCQPRPWRPSTTRQGAAGRSRTWSAGTSVPRGLGRKWLAILPISRRGKGGCTSRP